MVIPLPLYFLCPYMAVNQEKTRVANQLTTRNTETVAILPMVSTFNHDIPLLPDSAKGAFSKGS